MFSPMILMEFLFAGGADIVEKVTGASYDLGEHVHGCLGLGRQTEDARRNAEEGLNCHRIRRL